MSIKGSVILVTGAANGIGLATAKRFAAGGARVVMSDIDRERGEAEVQELREQSYDARFAYCDVGDPDSIDQLFAHLDSELGRLDFAFNNAGIEGNLVPIDTSDPSDWDRIIAINLSSIYHCMRHEIPMLRQAGGGAIINCSSIAGLVGTQGGGMYCATKHGVIGITRATALDVARDKIRVNAICPGAIDTLMVQRAVGANPDLRSVIEEMQPIGRMGTAEEIASAVYWLCQPDAALVTGIALPLDGGWTAR